MNVCLARSRRFSRDTGRVFGLGTPSLSDVAEGDDPAGRPACVVEPRYPRLERPSPDAIGSVDVEGQEAEAADVRKPVRQCRPASEGRGGLEPDDLGGLRARVPPRPR